MSIVPLNTTQVCKVVNRCAVKTASYQPHLEEYLIASHAILIWQDLEVYYYFYMTQSSYTRRVSGQIK